ncbi:hypothetical protein GCM10027058_19360 [Microbacterium neimengense]
MKAYTQRFSEAEGYLDFASYGPPSRDVVDTVASLMEFAARGGSAAQLHTQDARARTAVAALVERPADAIALTTSTSQGLAQTAFGMSGTVLVSTDEFPANLYPWWRAAGAGLLRVAELPHSGTLAPVTPERVSAALTHEVTALAVSAVDFRTGYRADLAALRDVLGPDRLLIVDGIQAFGVVESEWSAADVLVVGGQKWLRAGWGTGFVALSPRALERVAPVFSSWTGVVEPGVYDGVPHTLRTDAARFSVTNLSPFATGALASAAELLADTGAGRIARAIADRVDAVIDAVDTAGLELLSPRESGARSGIVVAGGDPATTTTAAERLAAAGITFTRHGAGRIRLAPHATTTTATLERAARALVG